MNYKVEIKQNGPMPEVWMTIGNQSFQLAYDPDPEDEDATEAARWFASQAQKALDKLAGQVTIGNKVHSIDTSSLFAMINQEHGLSLTDGQLMDIVHEVVKALGVPHPEPAPAQGDILSPEEWLESRGIRAATSEAVRLVGENDQYFKVVDLFESYASHVAARVARNVRHRDIEVMNQHFFEVEGLHSKIELKQKIMNIPLREVYPAGKNQESDV